MKINIYIYIYLLLNNIIIIMYVCMLSSSHTGRDIASILHIRCCSPSEKNKTRSLSKKVKNDWYVYTSILLTNDQWNTEKALMIIVVYAPLKKKKKILKMVYVKLMETFRIWLLNYFRWPRGIVRNLNSTLNLDSALNICYI